MAGAPWFIVLLLMIATSLMGYVVGFIHGGVLEMQKRNNNDNSDSSSDTTSRYAREERPTVVEINLNEVCRHRTVHSELDNGHYQPRLRRVSSDNFFD